MPKYILVAGSFEYLHAGHKALLKRALQEPEAVLVGLASDDFVRRKRVGFPVPLEKRRRELVTYLKHHFRKYRVIIFAERYDPTVFSTDLSKIVVSKDTYKYALTINKLRTRKGLPKLIILKVPSLLATDAKIISSARIKAGEIDRKGNLYFSQELLKYHYKMPHKTVSLLKKPWGKLVKFAAIKQRLNKRYKITVGDISTKKLLEHKVKIDLAIIDHRVKRVDLSLPKRVVSGAFDKKVKAKNPPSKITKDLLTKMLKLPKYFGKKSVLLEVAGEEDLAAIPALLIAPLHTVLFYGQPGRGLVMIEVNEQVKDKARVVLNSFKA